MGRFVDSVIAYRILRMLTIPFEDTDAYRLGIIDKNGKELKKMGSLNTVQERDAYSILHRMIFRIKRIIEKVPVENKKLASFAAALALIKEHQEKEPLNLEELFLKKLNTDLTEELLIVEDFINKNNTMTFLQFLENAPINNAAATPGIDGFTPETIGVRKKKKIIKRNGVEYVADVAKPV